MNRPTSSSRDDADVLFRYRGVQRQVDGSLEKGGDMAGTSRRFDPGRKDRIIDACLEVIAESGVAGASHRVIARRAGVPLGSMTYHFSGLHDLLHQAFARYAQRCIDAFAARMAMAGDADEACEQVARHIECDLLATRFDLVINLEFYTLAARDASFHDIADRWMTASRTELERFFTPEAAATIDALVEGLTLHRALGGQAYALDAQAIRDAIARIAVDPGPGSASNRARNPTRIR